MGRAVNPPCFLQLALLAALGVAACMPSEVEVGRDATLEVEEAGAGGRAPAARSSGGTGDSGMIDGGEPGAPSVGGATSAGASSALRGGNGGVASTPHAGRGGSAGSAAAGGRFGAAGSAVVPSGGTGGGPTVLTCPVPGSQEAAWTLEMFCSAFSCPSSADGAKDLLARSFEGCPGVANEVRTGCGLSQISVTSETQSDAYVYAEATRELVGATIHNDKPWGPCSVFRYYAGVMPSGCQAATACAFCGEMATCP